MYNIFKQLEDTSGKLDKLAILNENKDNTLLQYCFKLMLDDTLFYIKKIPQYTHDGEIIYNLEEAVALIVDYLATRKLTGNAGRDHLEGILSSIHPDDASIIKRIIKKDPDCGVSYKTINKVWKKLVKETGYMRCEASNEENYELIEYPAIAQTKADGAFTNTIVETGDTLYLTRNGNVLDFRGHLESQFGSMYPNESVVIHGEGLVLNDDGVPLPRKTGNGIISKAQHGSITDEQLSRIIFKIWDVVPYQEWLDGKSSEINIERFREIEKKVNELGDDRIRLIDYEIISNLDEGMDFYGRQLALEEEGAILKNFNGVWENRTSKNCVKMKVDKECELEVIEEIPHKKNKNLIGAVMCKSSCGQLIVKIGSGFTDGMRAKPFGYYLGKIITARFNEVIDSLSKETKSLFLPRIIEERLDKDEADTLEYIESLGKRKKK